MPTVPVNCPAGIWTSGGKGSAASGSSEDSVTVTAFGRTAGKVTVAVTVPSGIPSSTVGSERLRVRFGRSASSSKSPKIAKWSEAVALVSEASGSPALGKPPFVVSSAEL